MRIKLQDQDSMINKFSEEVRNLDISIERKQRDQDALDGENKQLR